MFYSSFCKYNMYTIICIFLIVVFIYKYDKKMSSIFSGDFIKGC